MTFISVNDRQRLVFVSEIKDGQETKETYTAEDPYFSLSDTIILYDDFHWNDIIPAHEVISCIIRSEEA